MRLNTALAVDYLISLKIVFEETTVVSIPLSQ